jgi:hypothetical protein
MSWKKITRGLPKIRRFANDRAPNIEEIQKISEYPDRRIKGIVYTMASSWIRLGTWDYMRWKRVQPVEREGEIVAAKIIVYAGDDEEYFSFITPEAYHELNDWMTYREDAGEKIDQISCKKFLSLYTQIINVVCHLSRNILSSMSFASFSP